MGGVSSNATACKFVSRETCLGCRVVPSVGYNSKGITLIPKVRHGTEAVLMQVWLDVFAKSRRLGAVSAAVSDFVITSE